jgi:hypothetical protein
MKVYYEAIVTYEEMLRMLELDSEVFSEKRMITRKSTLTISIALMRRQNIDKVNMFSCPLRRDKVKSHHSGVYSAFGRRIL